MAIRREEVERIAELARLRLDGERLERIAAELGAILDFVAQLDRLDLAGLGPTALAPPDAALREDLPDDRRLAPAAALAAAPAAEDGYVLTPPIVENLNP